MIPGVQFTGARDGLISVLNAGVLCYAPGFVVNDSVTVPTGCVRAVFAVARREMLLYRHWLVLWPWLITRLETLSFRITLRVAHLSSTEPPDRRSVLTLLESTY